MLLPSLLKVATAVRPLIFRASIPVQPIPVLTMPAPIPIPSPNPVASVLDSPLLPSDSTILIPQMPLQFPLIRRFCIWMPPW